MTLKIQYEDTGIPPLPRVTDISPNLGCDPEFFFRKDGEIIGAEKVLPEKGLSCATTSKFIIDGVQAELNPVPNYCRANLANEIAKCFIHLKAELDKNHKGVKVDFNRTIEISKPNLDELKEQSKKFGCAPSNSIYIGSTGVKIADVDPEKYRTRAAGGHIHIGNQIGKGIQRALGSDHIKTVKMLDLICGNTCVLVDRDPSNIERRKVYGKAGEFRLPPHGLEYRTLSNFWLTSYPLMSLAFGLARLAVQLIADDRHELYFNSFMDKVNPNKVRDAINNNDFDQAGENFIAIEKLLMEVTYCYEGRHPINAGNILDFYRFVDITKERGIQYWFQQDPMTHWTTLTEAHRGGFDDFLKEKVRQDKCKAKKQIKKTA